MKLTIFVVNTMFAIVFAQSADNNKYKNIPIVAEQNQLDHEGTFSYSFEGGDGTRAEQNGQLKYVDANNAGESVQGGFSFPGDDGKTYSLSYTADENGYRPTGDHLPTPPPVPPAIARALAYLATLPSTTDNPSPRRN